MVTWVPRLLTGKEGPGTEVWARRGSDSQLEATSSAASGFWSYPSDRWGQVGTGLGGAYLFTLAENGWKQVGPEIVISPSNAHDQWCGCPAWGPTKQNSLPTGPHTNPPKHTHPNLRVTRRPSGCVYLLDQSYSSSTNTKYSLCQALALVLGGGGEGCDEEEQTNGHLVPQHL